MRGRKCLLITAVAAAALVLTACGVAKQPMSIRQVTAIEVPLTTTADRTDLLAILSAQARSGGLHVDDASGAWAKMTRDAPGPPTSAASPVRKTIYVGLWRGIRDDDAEVIVDDGGHQGRAWVTFLRGKHPELAERARIALLAQIKARWPDARPIPVMPNGALPLAEDLIWSGEAYAVRPDRVEAYSKLSR
jgi:hypothetical protein